MARTLDEIKAAIRADFVGNITLQEAYGLDATKTFDEQFSAVSLESIWTFIVATAIYLLELIIDQKQTDIESMIASDYPFSFPWYYDMARQFQLGDSLVFDETTYKFAYATPDATKQIVQYVAIRQREVSGVTKLQVYSAKANKAALSASELAAFQAYIQQIGAAGTHFEFISLAPDALTINLTVTYDPQVVGYDGTRLNGTGKPVDEAVAAYLDGIKYSGSFSRTKLVDAVQAADGVIDVVIGDVDLNGELANGQTFESPSGFFTAETINVTYTAGNVY